MRIIFGQYRGLLISGLIFIFLFSVITVPMLPKLGTSFKEADHLNTYTGYLDSSAYRTVSERAAPAISCDTGRTWSTGETVTLQQAFIGKDADGSNTVIKVTKITDKTGSDLTGKFDKTTGSIIFASSGVYYFTLQTIDDQQKESEKILPLVVDNKGGSI